MESDEIWLLVLEKLFEAPGTPKIEGSTDQSPPHFDPATKTFW
jgi:hypothetical protein